MGAEWGPQGAEGAERGPQGAEGAERGPLGAEGAERGPQSAVQGLQLAPPPGVFVGALPIAIDF